MPNYNLPAIRDEEKNDPEWVTPDMRRFADRVFFDLTRQREKGTRAATTAGLCKSIGLPEDQEAQWTSEHGLAWAEYRNARVMIRMKELIPEVWATAFQCAIGNGDEGQIRGLGHLIALMRRLDPEYAVKKSEVKAELSVVDSLRSLRRGDE